MGMSGRITAPLLIATVLATASGRCDEVGDLTEDRAASFMLWSDPWIEIGVGYPAGVVRQGLTCTDEADDYSTTLCLDGDNTVIRLGDGSQPGGLVARLAVHPTRTFGVGAALSVDWPHPTDFADESLAVGKDVAWGPAWDLLVGPVFRLHGPVERMVKALRVRVSPGLYVRHGRIRPMAGNAGMASAPVLDSGTYGWTRGGAGVSVELEAEMTRAATFRGLVQGGVAIPAEPPSLVTVEEPDSDFSGEFEVERLDCYSVGLQLGVAFVAPRGVVAVEPSLLVRHTRTNLSVDDELAFGVHDPYGAGIDTRTYSTRQGLTALYGQLTIRSAIGPRP